LSNEMLNKNIQRWQGIVNQAPQRLEFKTYTNCTHLFLDEGTTNVTTQFIQDITFWIKNH
jgi:hypothetical protein